MRISAMAKVGLAAAAVLVFVGLLAMAACPPGGAFLGSLPFFAIGAALSADRSTPMRDGSIVNLGVAATKKIYAGALVARDASGYATPGATATTLRGVGRAEAQADNSSGADGAVTVDVRKGIFRFANSLAGDQITNADIGADCYIVDDQTVAKTNGGSTRSVAGVVFDVDSDGVWVRFN